MGNPRGHIKIIEYELLTRTKTIEEIDIDPEEKYSSEIIAQNYYLRKGYTIVNCSCDGTLISLEPALEKLGITKKEASEVGVPDFCIYKKDENGKVIDAFFTEVKWNHGANLDGIWLRGTQIEWIFTKKVPVKLIIIEDEPLPFTEKEYLQERQNEIDRHNIYKEKMFGDENKD